MADDIIINVGSDNEEIQIHPVETVNNINTEVSGDKYYTDLARSWAISDNLVANTDYSSKYYANISKNYAINAELSATNASNSAATAVLKADAANISASNAYIWAEGTDEEIIAIGGTHSSKGWVNYILNNAPTATTTRTATGAIITVSDIIHGVTTSKLFDGAKGDKGDKGDKGEKGDTGIKGDTGATGADGFSPIATVEKVGNTATITITDKNGTTTTNIYDGAGSITDVTVNDISVLDGSVAKIDLTNYVTNSTLATTLTDYVTNSTLTVTLADYALLSDIPTVPTTDQTYNSASSNPQSGTAVAEAIAGVNIPIATSTTVGKVKPDNTTTKVDANGTLSAISRNVGEIVQSTLPLTDAGLHLLDGARLSGDGIYKEFVDYIAELYSETLTDWTQPVLTSNGTMGGSNFAVSSNIAQYTGNDVWRAFNGMTSGGNYFHSQSGTKTGYIDIFNPVPIKITNFKIYNQNGSANRASSSGIIYGSNDGTSWTQLKTYTNSVQTAGGTWNIDLSANENYYRYYRMESTAGGSDSYWTINEIQITAKYKKLPNYFCTETEWQASVTQYGSCGKFVYNNVTYYAWYYDNSTTVYTTSIALGDTVTLYSIENGYITNLNKTAEIQERTGFTTIVIYDVTGWHARNSDKDELIRSVRLPKVSDILQGTTDLSALGDLIKAGLPNILGITSYRSDLVSGAFGTYQGTAYGLGTSTSSSNCINFDASRSSSLYKNNFNKVQPQTIKTLLYIVIATSSKTDIQVDIDEIATDLNGKADNDLTNVTDTGYIKMAGASMPSSRYINLTLGASGSTYTAPADGWYYFDKQSTQQTQLTGTYVYDTNNNFIYAQGNGYHNIWILPVLKGYKMIIYYTLEGQTNRFRFIYAKGSESEAQ
jgi:hypothetical protein